MPEGGLGQIGLDAAQLRDTGAQDGPGSARLPARGPMRPFNLAQCCTAAFVKAAMRRLVRPVTSAHQMLDKIYPAQS